MPIFLTSETISKLRERTDIKRKIVEEFGLEPEHGLRTVNRWLKQNKPNNPLTCKAALLIISKWLCMSEKSLINEKESNQKGSDDPQSHERGSTCKAGCGCL